MPLSRTASKVFTVTFILIALAISYVAYLLVRQGVLHAVTP
jgi:hypothetical protein